MLSNQQMTRFWFQGILGVKIVLVEFQANNKEYHASTHLSTTKMNLRKSQASDGFKNFGILWLHIFGAISLIFSLALFACFVHSCFPSLLSLLCPASSIGT